MRINLGCKFPKINIGWEYPRGYVLRHWLFALHLYGKINQIRICGLYITVVRG